MSEVLEKFIERLTSNYNAVEGSNIKKLLDASSRHIQENEDALKKIMDWRDVDKAEGKALELIGSNVGQNRGQSTDDVYRTLIKSKIKRSLSDGSINTMIDFISFLLGVPKSDVKITELWSTGSPAELHLDVPGGAIGATGLTLNQFGTLINLVIAAGVKAHVLFEGTFSFSSQAAVSETDASGQTGFADVAQTKGGTLGAAYNPATDYELPL